MSHHAPQLLWRNKGMELVTGGGVFWRHLRICIIFSSCFTCSTSCLTSRLAAPARPTFTVIGFTRALRAKFWIFFGIVAENNSVCLCPCKKKTMASTVRKKKTMVSTIRKKTMVSTFRKKTMVSTIKKKTIVSRIIRDNKIVSTIKEKKTMVSTIRKKTMVATFRKIMVSTIKKKTIV